MTPMRTRKRARMTVHMQPADDFSSILRMAIVAFDTLRHVHPTPERKNEGERKRKEDASNSGWELWSGRGGSFVRVVGVGERTGSVWIAPRDPGRR
jgi:hypothetical protein